MNLKIISSNKLPYIFYLLYSYMSAIDQCIRTYSYVYDKSVADILYQLPHRYNINLIVLYTTKLIVDKCYY